MNGKTPYVIGTIISLIGIITFALSFRSGVLQDSADWQKATSFSLAEGASLRSRVDRTERDIEKLWEVVARQGKDIQAKLEKIMERLPQPYPPAYGPR